MQLRLWFVFFILIASVTGGQEASATPIFAGSFVNLSVDQREKNISVNYPRAGKHGICGVEIKSNIIVLNGDVWRRLAALLEVSELHDDRLLSVVEPTIERGYSPTLRYVFSRLESDYGTLAFHSKNGQTLKEVANLVLGDKWGDVGLLAVAYSCD
jgi:hypothetical protein